ncbi:MAG: putative branched-chain alpha-keto acid dehydrogenase, dihydrolipoamide acyltransferase [Chloroflexi bacterium]|nr:putative branched-chain alpha-keto acid dehydrogenase, dihydrolipoamide acyltransferase [Chloroflexota bacterium]
MPVQVLMPQFGESVVEGTITRWLKSEGDAVDEYEPLVEVNTDKVDTEIPCPVKGRLSQILVDAGNTVLAGTVLAMIAPESESASEMKQVLTSLDNQAATEKMELSADVAPPKKPATQPIGRTSNLGFISPVVSRMAQEYHIDLSRIQGSGLGGRITKNDLMDYLEKHAEGSPISGAIASLPQPAQPTYASPVPGQVLPLTAVRRSIAEHMVFSKRTSPHVTTVMEADLSRVTAHRLANKEPFAREGTSLTYSAYFVAAAAQALKASPIVNSSWVDEAALPGGGIRIHSQINIGLATSLGEGGLIVPVIRAADGLSLLGIARAVNDLSNRARLRQLRPEEVKGGTFTITNHGTSGSLFATPIINQPQCGILGVGMIQKRVVVLTDERGNDSIAIRPMVYLSFTFDHRILDGAIADQFLGKVVELLEHFGP